MVTVLDRQLFLADVAELAGVKPTTIAAYRARGAARFPEPDGEVREGMYMRPWWHESTVRAWLAERPGRGWWRRDTPENARR